MIRQLDYSKAYGASLVEALSADTLVYVATDHGFSGGLAPTVQIRTSGLLQVILARC